MSIPKDVVWREERFPHQWIGMHYHHRGGIRCNSRDEAVAFMLDLCGERGCAWVAAHFMPTFKHDRACNDNPRTADRRARQDESEGAL